MLSFKCLAFFGEGGDQAQLHISEAKVNKDSGTVKRFFRLIAISAVYLSVPDDRLEEHIVGSEYQLPLRTNLPNPRADLVQR